MMAAAGQGVWYADNYSWSIVNKNTFLLIVNKNISLNSK
jgi:hypothetical protein